jgi:hypothetical protein
MPRTLPQLQAELIVRIGDDTIDTDTSQSWINASWQEVLDYYPWPFLKAEATGALGGTTAAQTWSSVFSVTDFARGIQFLVGTTPMSRIDWEDKDLINTNLVYAITPDMTGFVTPGSETGTAKIKYIRNIPDLSGNVNITTPSVGVSGVPDPFHKAFEEAIIAGGATRFFQNAIKPGMADYWQSQRNFYLDSVIDQYIRLSTGDAVKVATLDYNERGHKAF